MAVTGAENARDVTTRQVAAIEYRFKNASRFGRKRIQAYLFLYPEQDTRAQPVRFRKAFHEGNLIKAGLEKEFREGGKRRLA